MDQKPLLDRPKDPLDDYPKHPEWWIIKANVPQAGIPGFAFSTPQENGVHVVEACRLQEALTWIQMLEDKLADLDGL